MDGNHDPKRQPCRPSDSHRLARVWSLLTLCCLMITADVRISAQDLPAFSSVPNRPKPITAGETSGRADAVDPSVDEQGRSTLWRPPVNVIPTDGAPAASVRAASTPRRLSMKPVGIVDQTPHPADTSAAPTDAATPSPLAPTSVAEALERPGTVTFRKTPLQEVVFLLSDLWQINIVAGEAVTGDVSGTFHETPLREVLSAILSASGYGYRQTGNSLIILSADEIGSDDPGFVSQTLRVPPNDNADGLLEAARMLISERGQIVDLGGTQVLIKDYPDRVAKVKSFFDDLAATTANTGSRNQHHQNAPVHNVPNDNGGELTRRIDGAFFENDPIGGGSDEIRIFRLDYTEAEHMQESLEAILADNATVAVYVEENRVMVRGDARQLRIAEEAIRQLDRPRPQVRITALIYDVSIEEVERLGINWNVSPHSSGITGLLNSEEFLFRNAADATTNFFADQTLASAGAANLAIRSINDRATISALLHALDNSGESKLLADPSITVGDRHEAEINIVQRVPIIAIEPAAENSVAVVAQVQFEDAGVKLKVKPRIGPDGTIEMQVAPEFSVVVGFTEEGNFPIIDSRNATTTLRVGNGQVFALGGLRQKNVVENVSGVPYLKDFKYLGKLFRSHDTTVRESELIVFLKPGLVTPFDHVNLRQQRASCVTGMPLDAIRYATSQSQLSWCQDPYCPNQQPRPRLNGGSRELEMLGGFGMEGYPAEVRYDFGGAEAIRPSTIVSETTHPRPQGAIPDPDDAFEP